VQITTANVDGLSQFCSKFGFRGLAATIAAFRQIPGGSHGGAVEDAEGRARIEVLERQWAALQTLSTEVAALRAQMSALSCQLTLFQSPPSPRLESVVVTEFPTAVLSEFQAKQFVLLWRGTRDGFNSSVFHSRCDGRGNTVTFLRDISGCIFGAFSPIPWDSSGVYKDNHPRRSFVFALKHPWGPEAKKFAMANHAKAIFGHDIYVASNGNASMDSYTSLGTNYVNDTGRDKRTVFTGSHHFRVNGVEVFQVAGEITGIMNSHFHFGRHTQKLIRSGPLRSSTLSVVGGCEGSNIAD
jgi:hypothetical protein